MLKQFIIKLSIPKAQVKKVIIKTMTYAIIFLIYLFIIKSSLEIVIEMYIELERLNKIVVIIKFVLPFQ